MHFSRKLATIAITALAVSGLPLPAASASVDADGDKLLDTWETEGYDYNNDGVIDIDFPALGADPNHKDIFVEMDYMPGEIASEAELDTIVQTFAELPLDNPDGSNGINLHLDAGSIYPKYDLGGGNEIPHKALTGVDEAVTLRGTESDPARTSVFHYMIWGDYYGNSSSSGQGWLHGREFIVTVGQTYWGQATSETRIGTFIHELGHNLGLRHGGTDEVNFKPNYLSIMNYSYQLTGLKRTDGSTYFGYSTRTGDTLDETNLVEATGLGQAAQGFYVTYNDKEWVANEGIDFDNDGSVESTPQAIDINGDGSTTSLTAPNDLETLTFQASSSSPNTATSSQETAEPVVESNELTADIARDLGYLPAE